MKGLRYFSSAVSMLMFCVIGSGCNPEVSVNTMAYPAVPPAATTEYEDNPEMFFAIENFTADKNSVTINFRVGTESAGIQNIATPAQADGRRIGFFLGRLSQRPLNSTSQVGIHYCKPGDAVCANPLQASGAYQVNQSISSGLKVAGVWFHELRASNNSSNRSNYSAANARQLVDNTDYAYEHTATPSADAVYAQCASSYRWQFRFYKSDVINVDPSLLDVVENPEVPLYRYENLADALDPGQQYLHVFWVNSFTGRDGSQLGGYADDFNNVILLVDYYTPFRTSAVLAHEYGHIQGLGHTGQGCDQGENHSNLMCVGVWGRTLTDAQCRTMFSNGARLLDLH